MRRNTTRNVAFAGIFLALAIVLPFLTLQLQQLGNKLLPMHLPVLLCGFICGWPFGLAVGVLAPLLRSFMFGMPPLMPIAVAMAFELGTYGLVSGLMLKLFPRKNIFVYLSLILSMVAGRIVWGIVSMALFGIQGNSFTWSIFMTQAWINAIPGIILQLVLIPLIIIAFKRAGLIDASDKPSLKVSGK